MKALNSSGFSLVELAITLVVMGLILTFAIPSYQSLSQSYQLRGAAENVAGQFRIAREKAIGTGVQQQLVFSGGSYSAKVGGTVVANWSLPRGVSYNWATGTDSNYTLATDGRMNKSGMVILQDTKGHQDTVSVQLSGLVLSQ